jgi:hypothetical protein
MPINLKYLSSIPSNVEGRKEGRKEGRRKENMVMKQNPQFDFFYTSKVYIAYRNLFFLFIYSFSRMLICLKQ